MMVAPEREVPGISANACAQADLQGVGPAHGVDVVDAHGIRTRALPALRPQDDERADDERDRHRHRGEQRSLDHAAEQEPEQRGGQEGDDEVDDEAIGDRIAQDAARHGDESRPELPAHGEDGAGLDHDLEDLGLLARVAQERARDDQMSGRRDRQEFRQTFDDAEQEGDEQGRRGFQAPAIVA